MAVVGAAGGGPCKVSLYGGRAVADPGVLVLTDRFDITLEAVSRVAWGGERIALAKTALETMDRCAPAFDASVALRVRADPQALIYGLTSAPGDRATVVLGPEAQASRPSRLWTAMSYGGPLPARVTRAIVLARLPRVLGASRRAQSLAENAANVSLSSVTDNPVFLPSSERHPDGAVYSTGGFHNAQAAPAIDALAFAHADLCQLSQRLSDHLFQHPTVAPLVGGDEWSVKPLHRRIPPAAR